MITLFSIPRDFSGIFETIQTNAIKSWVELAGVEVILFGQSKGAAEVCEQFKLRHIPDVQTNQYGTPLISDAFRQAGLPAGEAGKLTKSPLLGYINCDMILLPDFLSALKNIPLNKFLLAGQRRPLVMKKQVVGEKNWQKEIYRELGKQKSRPKLGSSDYFVYPRNVNFNEMPPFAVGKLYWDKWLYYEARRKSIPIIDATTSITAVHQQHYMQKNVHGYGEDYLGEQARENRSMMPFMADVFTIFDADYLFKNGKIIKPEMNFMKFLRKVQMNLIVLGNKHLLLKPLLWILAWLRRNL